MDNNGIPNGVPIAPI